MTSEPMIYLRNVTLAAQWLTDPQTGIGRKIEPEALARVTQQVAEHALATEPGKWQRVEPIALGGT